MRGPPGHWVRPRSAGEEEARQDKPRWRPLVQASPRFRTRATASEQGGVAQEPITELRSIVAPLPVDRPSASSGSQACRTFAAVGGQRVGGLV
eukprot:10333181-Lingulodinium_polyedra.AAC.1